jgi:hypothetical protein
MCDSFKRNFLSEFLEVPYEVIEYVETLIASGNILKIFMSLRKYLRELLRTW